MENFALLPMLPKRRTGSSAAVNEKKPTEEKIQKPLNCQGKSKS